MLTGTFWQFCVTERAKLHHKPVILAVLVVCSAACRVPQRAAGVYAHDTRALVRLDYDYDADGVIDVRTYMRNGRPVRLEGDANRDGRIDRWEYYGPAGELLRLGSSTEGDGREDSWLLFSGDERHVDISTRRDGIADRRERYSGDELVGTQADTDHDGLPDTWEEFENGALARVLFDETKRVGRPTRRIVYAPGGGARVEQIHLEGTDASR